MKMKIVGVSGKARAGKDSIAERLVKGHGYVRLAFADPLKEAARAIFGLSDAQLYGDFKETVDAFWGKTPRKIMQLLGTDAVRRNIDDDVWIKSTWQRMDRLRSKPDVVGVVIPDVRFKNEADAIRGWGGEVWRVERPGVDPVEEHVSERDLDVYPHFSAVLVNDKAVLDLHTRVDELLQPIDKNALLKRAYDALGGEGSESDGRVGQLLADLRASLEVK